MKKIIFIVILLIIAVVVLFKMEVKPESKEVVAEVKPSINSASPNTPVNNINLPSQ